MIYVSFPVTHISQGAINETCRLGLFNFLIENLHAHTSEWVYFAGALFWSD